MAVSLSLRQVSYRYQAGTRRERLVLNECSVDFYRASVNVLLGISGSGKSTLLNLIAGRLQPTSGVMHWFGGSDEVQDQERQADGVVVGTKQLAQQSALVPQTGGVYPDETVMKNLKLALSRSSDSKSDRQEQLTRVIELCQLEHVEAQRCSQLSGGECHRVALARGLLKAVPVLMFDEPLSHTDVGLRESLKSVIANKATKEGRTIIYVTHDPIEAMSIADSISILDEGRVIQSGTPDTVFKAPVSPQAMRLLSVWPINQISVSDLSKCHTKRSSDVFIRADGFRLQGGGKDDSAELQIRVDAIRSVAGKTQLTGKTESGSNVTAVISTNKSLAVGERVRLVAREIYQF